MSTSGSLVIGAIGLVGAGVVGWVVSALRGVANTESLAKGRLLKANEEAMAAFEKIAKFTSEQILKVEGAEAQIRQVIASQRKKNRPDIDAFGYHLLNSLEELKQRQLSLGELSKGLVDFRFEAGQERGR